LNTKPAENATNPNGLKTVWEAAHGSVRRLPSMALPTDPLPDCQPTPNWSKASSQAIRLPIC